MVWRQFCGGFAMATLFSSAAHVDVVLKAVFSWYVQRESCRSGVGKISPICPPSNWGNPVFTIYGFRMQPFTQIIMAEGKTVFC